MISDYPFPRVDGQTVRQLRHRNVLSIHSLADEADVSPSSIVRMEKGERCQPRTIRKVASVLGVPPWKLLPKDGDE